MDRRYLRGLDEDYPSTISVYNTPQPALPALDDFGTKVAEQATRRNAQLASAETPVQKQLNPDVVPLDFIALQKQLAAQGSETSTLAQILSWVSAAKGDFRGLLQIEDAKRRTAIGKAIIPHIQKYNDLVNTGKLDEATTYLDTISTSFGERAPELVPYLTQMAAKLNKRQEGLQLATGLHNYMKDVTPEGGINEPVVKALGNLVKNRDLTSEQLLANLMTRAGTHIQILNGRAIFVNPQTQEMRTEAVPGTVQPGQTDTYTGNALAALYGMNTTNLQDILNDVDTKLANGTVVKKGSAEAALIKKQYSSLLLDEARLIRAKLLQMDPTTMLEAVEVVGADAAAQRLFTGDQIAKIRENVINRAGLTEAAKTRATVAVNPFAPAGADYVPVHVNVNDPATFLTEATPRSLGEMEKPGSLIVPIRRQVLAQVQPLKYGISSLQLIPQMFEGNEPESKGDRIAGAINNAISAYIGYPVTEKVLVRQAAKAILDRTVNLAEDTLGKDSAAIKELRQSLTANLRSANDYINAARFIEMRLSQAVLNLVGGTIPQQQTPVTTTPSEVVTPVGPRVPTSTTPQGRQPVTIGKPGQKGSAISPELDKQLQEAEQRDKARLQQGQQQPSGQQQPRQQTAPTQKPLPYGTPEDPLDLEGVKRAMREQKRKK